MAKIVSNISSSSIVTASLPDSTDVSSVDTGSLSSAFSSIDSGSLTATVSASALNASVTDSSALSSSAAVADASVTAASSPVSDSAAAASATVPAAASSGSSLSASAAAPSATDSTSTVVPLTLVRRIAQDDLPDVAQGWQDLCLASGGDIFTDEPCVKLAGVNGINALLADADPCAQQDNADAMIDFAKSTGVTNSDALIANAVAYRQHPRNALNINGVIPSTPYCQRAPRNAELTGLVNAQLPGVNPGIYGGPNFGLVAFGDPSSCPFGTSANVDSCGCA
ncbi:hypothetical protein BDW22DRAFT_1325280 [Trametopsis cervina]|nr:hypothetical protein BDW22DRAFT_1325280 [Trametopsis cervina]